MSARPGKLFYARAIYFCYYLALGALYPFLNLYYERVGLSGPQIGFLASLSGWLTPFAGSLWSGFADRFGLHRRLLTWALLGTLVTGFAYSLTPQFWYLLLIAQAYALFSSPISALMDSAAVEIGAETGRSFGHLRVWGTLGWIVSTSVVGYLVGEIRQVFLVFAALMTLTVLVSLFQPPRKHTWERPVWEGIRILLGRPATLLFLLSVFLLFIANSGANQFLSIYLASIGAGSGLIGMAWAISALSEVPVMFFSAILIRKMGIRGFLSLAFLTYAARWLWLSAVRSPGEALAAQLLQGISFAAFLVGGVTYISRLAPPGLGTTAQSIFSSTTFGLGASVGAVIGGFLYQAIGLRQIYLVESGVALLAYAIFLIQGREARETP